MAPPQVVDVGANNAKTPQKLLLLLAIFGATTTAVQGLYVPGVAPTDFQKDDSIEVRAIKMTSTHTQLPYEYYSLPFCPPKDLSLIHI